MLDLSDIFEDDGEMKKDFKSKKVEDIFKEDKKPAKSRKKKEYSEEQKAAILERLRLGREKAAQKRNEDAKQDTKLDTKQDAKQEKPKRISKPIDNDIIKNIPVPEKKINKALEIDDDNERAEMKAFLTKLYKASKSQIVKNAIDKYDKPVIEEKKPDTIPDIKPEAKQEEPKISKEEQEQIEFREKLAKIKAQLANKKRR